MRWFVVLPGLFACQAPSEDSSPDAADRVDCPGTFDVIGSVVIDDPVALDALRGVRAIEGNLEIIAGGSISLPALCRVGGLSVRSSEITALSLPSLETVGGAIDIEDCPVLVDVDLGTLTTAGSIGIDSNRALQSVELPSLTAAAGLFITGNGVLRAVDAPSLTSVAGAFMVSGNDRLAEIALPGLASIAGTAVVVDNPVLTR